MIAAAGHDVASVADQGLESRYPGIAVLRIPQKASATDLLMLVETLMEALKSEVLIGKLWIVEIGRIRVYEEEDAD